MMYDEFQEKVKEYADGVKPRECSVGDYDIIEKVYTYHPMISAINGKKQVAMLWQEFGLEIFTELYPVTEQAMEFDMRIHEAKKKATDIEKEFREWYEKHI